MSPFAGVILATTLLGYTSMHIYNSKKPKPTERPGNGEFWAKHRQIDTNISNMFIHLPEQFKAPAGVRDTNVVFLNMTLQTSAICLHQAAMKTALKYHKDNSFIVQSMNRCITAADAITIATRRINHNDLSRVGTNTKRAGAKADNFRLIYGRDSVCFWPASYIATTCDSTARRTCRVNLILYSCCKS